MSITDELTEFRTFKSKTTAVDGGERSRLTTASGGEQKKRSKIKSNLTGAKKKKDKRNPQLKAKTNSTSGEPENGLQTGGLARGSEVAWTQRME